MINSNELLLTQHILARFYKYAQDTQQPATSNQNQKPAADAQKPPTPPPARPFGPGNQSPAQPGTIGPFGPGTQMPMQPGFNGPFGQGNIPSGAAGPLGAPSPPAPFFPAPNQPFPATLPQSYKDRRALSQGFREAALAAGLSPSQAYKFTAEQMRHRRIAEDRLKRDLEFQRRTLERQAQQQARIVESRPPKTTEGNKIANQ